MPRVVRAPVVAHVALTLALTLALALLAISGAAAFPDKLIRIIVPFTPGGSNDVVAREIATGLQERLKQNAVVENKPGGGGSIAYSYVAKSPPDGHVMLITPASFTMAPHLARNPGYNPLTEFAPINLIVDVPFVMVVPASLPARSVQEFIRLAKASDRKLSFASVGVGTPQHLAGELFKLHAGVDLVHVPFRGATMVLPDLLAGRIDMFIGAINSLLPLIEEGKLVALAVTRAQRVASLPNVPTMAEAAFPGFEVGSSVGLVAPAGTPVDIISPLNHEIGAIIATPGFKQRMATIGVEVVGTTPERYAQILREDYAKWGRVVAAAGIKPE
ncbi:MAG: Bug family tripartite tricarboxylate transporter substrate binding protein [Xanthobacteraceae bacterium]